MKPWGYIWIGIGCAAFAGVLFGLAQPTDFDYAMASADRAMGGSAEEPSTNGAVMFIAFVFALGASVFGSIGVIAEGVRVGSRAAQRAST